MSVSVFAPISIGNVSVGFDTLGLAVTPIDGTLVGDIVSIESLSTSASSQEDSQFVLAGSHADKLPSNKNENIVWRCLAAFNQALSKQSIDIQPVKITLEKNIPVSSGLGSSACSVVAGFVALNEFYNQPFDKMTLLKLMGALEAEISGSLHYDNVAPCYLGGLQLMLDDPEKITQTLPTFDDCYWVIAYPDIEVSTKAAREILPDSYDRKTLIQFGQNLAGFVDACYRKDKQQAFSLLKDVVAEPYRKKLLPNFESAQQTLKEYGCLATGISGSGPTLFAVCDNLETAEKSQQWLKQNYLRSDEGFVHICKVDNSGARKTN
ncbi:homoserine kinase [Aliikangiella coralliicola]|uniref:Homoserine kinase n=1 Tax=Aliikangiella coralliicola TaxID=2592383 RepID=A0A545U6L5_9GAMM|nr:homoserine kinase [Aliikangiella coralliicola]TQV85053.1 homoserine kinase [Aliikangiella coralliicola]